MNDVNWWLMALAFLLGLLLTFAFMIRRVKREVPVYAALGRGPGVDAGAAGIAGGVAGAKLGGGKVSADEEPYGSGSLRFAGAGAPSGYTIKGDEGSTRYYLPEAPDYGDVDGGLWFRDADDAERAGFKRWDWDIDGGALAAGAAGIAGGVAGAKLGGGKVSVDEEPYGSGSLRFAGAGAPSGYTIKGNEDSMLYHSPESPSYKQTIAEVWFLDADTAERAGFKRWDWAGAAAAGGAAGAATAKFAAIPDGPYGAGSAKPGPGGSGPEGWTIKGNEDSMLYHTPESPSYQRTIAEVWFNAESAAEKAGFTRWDKGRAGSGPAKLVEIPPGPYGAGSAEPGAGGSGPEGWTVKGNMDSMLYHSPESPAYAPTVAEVWFRDVDTAEKAGFNRWDSGKSQRGQK